MQRGKMMMDELMFSHDLSYCICYINVAITKADTPEDRRNAVKRVLHKLLAWSEDGSLRYLDFDSAVGYLMMRARLLEGMQDVD